jgi:predicted membrane protein
MMQLRTSSKQIALMAIFAALFVALNYITPIRILAPALGGQMEIGFAAFVATIFGIILGPYLGAGAALLGSAVSWAITGGSPFGLPFIMAPFFNALISGLIFYKKWKWGFLAFALMVIVFLFTPPVTPLTENWNVAVAVLFDKIITLFLILPVALLASRFLHPTTRPAANKPIVAYVFSVIGAALGVSIALTAFGSFFSSYGLGSLEITILSIWCIICSIVILIAGICLIVEPKKNKKWGKIISVFSVVGIGSIVAVIGGVLAMLYGKENSTYKRISVGGAASFFFLLGFIGNQADNMWGSMAFAIPGIYDKIFFMDVSGVRIAFLASPFLYPAIRLIEAIAVMIIAVPLMQALSGTNWLWSKNNILADDKSLEKSD